MISGSKFRICSKRRTKEISEALIIIMRCLVLNTKVLLRQKYHKLNFELQLLFPFSIQCAKKKGIAGTKKVTKTLIKQMDTKFGAKDVVLMHCIK